MDKPVSALRQDYSLRELSETDADADPMRLFDSWFDAAVRAGILEPNAMSLATVDAQGRPSVRIVLLKGFDARGLVFYTDYHSRKGRELSANPNAALCFWWPPMERQVRIEGSVASIPPAESDAYFATRPRESQFGAQVSNQSEVIADRAVLERRLQELRSVYQDRAVPRPPHWGGYRLSPRRIEFWQGRPSRLHDRLLYSRGADGAWTCERLSP